MSFSGGTLAYVFLILAVLSLWVSNLALVWNGLLAVAMAIALGFQVITPVGLAISGVVAASIYAYFRGSYLSQVKRWLAVLMLMGVLGLSAHVFPGFKEHTLYAHVILTPGAYPTSLYWCFDKPLAGLLLVGWGMSRIRSGEEWKRVVPIALAAFVLCAGLILVLAWPMGLIRWAPKPAWLTGQFALTNLIFVCIPEEALFRGFLQKKLSDFWADKPQGRLWSLVIASVIFGICHFKGGIGLILMATVAGLFYGAAFQRTGRVEAGILVHVLLNTTHYALFTYPLLKL